MTPRVRRWIVRSAAVLILGGVLLELLFSLGFFDWIYPQALIWVWLPHHHWRFRLMTDEHGAVCLRTYFGFWADFRFHPGDWGPDAIVVGDLLLLTLLPEWLKSEFARQRAARKHVPTGRCRRCDYDLTGNISGVCPECGTPIR